MVDIGEEVLKRLVEVLANQEQTWANEASAAQIQAHQASGKSAACKLIKDIVLNLVKEVEAVIRGAEAESEKVEQSGLSEKTAVEIELEKRRNAGACTFRKRIKSGEYEWCGLKKTRNTDYCRKHNKELGLTNAKK